MFFYCIFWISLFPVYSRCGCIYGWLCTACVPGAQGGHNSALDSLKMELATVCAGNRTLGLMEKQPVLLTTEPSDQPFVLLCLSPALSVSSKEQLRGRI